MSKIHDCERNSSSIMKQLPQSSDSSDPRYFRNQQPLGLATFRRLVTFEGSLLSGNKNRLQIELARASFSSGIDGLPDYHIGRISRYRRDRVLHLLRGGKLNCFDCPAWRTAAFQSVPPTGISVSFNLNKHVHVNGRKLYSEFSISI